MATIVLSHIAGWKQSRVSQMRGEADSELLVADRIAARSIRRAIEMKQQFIREEHNRQDKARNEPYRHSMLEYGRGSTGKTEWNSLARMRFSNGSVRFDTKSLGARMERRARFHCAIFKELEAQHFQIQKFVISMAMKLPEFQQLNRLPQKTAEATFRRVKVELEERMMTMKRRIQRTEIRCEELTDPRSGEVSESWCIDFDLTGLLQPVQENQHETK